MKLLISLYLVFIGTQLHGMSMGMEYKRELTNRLRNNNHSVQKPSANSSKILKTAALLQASSIESTEKKVEKNDAKNN